MPPKRKSHKMRTKSVPNHPHPAPSVNVKPNHGSEMENTLSPMREELPTTSAAAAAAAAVAASGNPFAVPQRNTTMRQTEEMNELQNMRVVPPELTPRSKAAIAPKVSLKMNFPPNVAVFKNLTSLNVNDSLSNWEQGTKAVKPSTKTDPPEPLLSQYVEKIEPIPRYLPEPDLQLEFPVEDFDFLKAYKKLYKFK